MGVLVVCFTIINSLFRLVCAPSSSTWNSHPPAIWRFRVYVLINLFSPNLLRTFLFYMKLASPGCWVLKYSSSLCLHANSFLDEIRISRLFRISGYIRALYQRFGSANLWEHWEFPGLTNERSGHPT